MAAFARATSAALAFVALALVAAPVCAQGLPELTVTAFSMRSDRVRVAAGQTFHVTIHVHVKQRVAQLPWVVLHDLTNVTNLGIERHTTPGADGTDHIEVLSLAATAPGVAIVTPATIDAVDPTRGNRPFRFGSSAVTVAVSGDVAQSTPTIPWAPIAGAAIAVLSIVALVAICAALIRTVAKRRRTYVTLPTPRPVAPRPTGPVDRAAPIRAAVAQLRAVRTRANAAVLRAALFASAGARADETLEALLARTSVEPVLRAPLRAAERAVFIEERSLQAAIDDLLAAVQQIGYA